MNADLTAIIAEVLDQHGEWGDYKCSCGWRDDDLRQYVTQHQAEQIAARLGIEHQRDAWVHTGERIYVEGVPFGGWQEIGEAYHCEPGDAGLSDGDAPLFRVRGLEDD